MAFPGRFQEFRHVLASRQAPAVASLSAHGPVCEPERARTPNLDLGIHGKQSAADAEPSPRGVEDVRSDLPPLEPFAVLLASISAPGPSAPEPRAVALPELVAADVVRSIAWGGDRRRGAARLELAGERLGGTRVVVEVEGTRVRLSLDAPSGVDPAEVAELRSRLCARFLERGLDVEGA
jgi:hypothetical protein